MNDADRILMTARLRDPSVKAFLAYLEQNFPAVAAGEDVTVNKVWLCALWLAASRAEREECAKLLSEMAEGEARREVAAREGGDGRLADHLQGVAAYLDSAAERIRARGQ